MAISALSEPIHGRGRGEPSGAGADFSFASSDFKTLGAFFCNFATFRAQAQDSTSRICASGATRHRSAVGGASAASRGAPVRELRAELV